MIFLKNIQGGRGNIVVKGIFTMARTQRIPDQKAHPTVSATAESISPHGLPGALCVPSKPVALIIFAHAGNSFRCNPRNAEVAQALNGGRMATLMLDLLHPHETADRGLANVFDIDLLSVRLVEAIRWADQQTSIRNLPIGLLCTDTAAAAALVTAGQLQTRVGAIVCLGGRPDLAGSGLKTVRAPTLLVVGGTDYDGIELNKMAFSRLSCMKTLEIVEGASHAFTEPSEHEAAKVLSCAWFDRHLKATRT